MIKSKNAFLIDSNSLITPYRSYYPFDFAGTFWKQLMVSIVNGEVVLLDLVGAEISKGEDDLSKWVNSVDRRLILSRNSSAMLSHYADVLKYIQTSGLYTGQALNRWASGGVADPWLIAAAKSYSYTLVTLERPNSGLNPLNKSGSAKIPDVCNALHVDCCDLFRMMRALSFKL